MKVIFRYKTAKPTNGHFHFMLHGGAENLGFSEHWHSEKGWEVILDALEDTREPKERRSFFLCNGGDDLTFLGDFPSAYYVGSHEAKGYTSYLFETTHLSETEREKGVVQSRYARPKPHVNELSYKAREAIERERRQA